MAERRGVERRPAAPQLDRMLASVLANAACPEAQLIVFALDADEELIRICAKHGASLIPCQSLASDQARDASADALVPVLLAAAHLVRAEAFLCVSSEMVVIEELRSAFTALDALPDGSLLVTRRKEGGRQRVDPSLFGARRRTLLAMEAAVERAVGTGRRGSSKSQRRKVPRVTSLQSIVRRVFSRYPRCVELHATYNVPADRLDAEPKRTGACIEAFFHGERVRVLRAGSSASPVLPFADVPLPNGPDRDDYAAFLVALRRWIGQYGASGLVWSFYGTPDGETGRVRDRTTLPLFAAVHALVRANGCVRVIETGTTRGISAACLASAVCGRAGAGVVTFDPYTYEGRHELLALLPERMRGCIELRQQDSIEGMTAALAAGEKYEAAFLDSEHRFDHVLAEFQLATKLVCPGGLILIHDARFKGGDVPRVLEHLEQSGYGVVRLWTADAGVCEDNEIGLAVVENRCRRPG